MAMGLRVAIPPNTVRFSANCDSACSKEGGALLSIYTHPSSSKLGRESSNRSIPVAAAKTPKNPAITSGAAAPENLYQILPALCFSVLARIL